MENPRLLKRSFFLVIVVVMLSYIGVAAISHLMFTLPNTPAALSLSQDTTTETAAIIETPHDALSIRLSMIDSAKSSIELAYHTAKWDTSSVLIFGAIHAAAERGVTVTLLLDQLMSGLPKPIPQALAAHPNISFYQFGEPSLGKASSWNHRLHDKFMIVDRQYALLGGRNLADKYFNPKGFNGPISHDRDVFIAAQSADEGTGITQLSHYFNTLVASPDSQRVINHHHVDANAIKDAFDNSSELYAHYIRPMVFWVSNTVDVDTITLIHNPITEGIKPPTLGATLHSLMSSAQDRIIIQSPYIVPTPPIRQALDSLLAEVDISLLTNSTLSTPNFPAYSAYLDYKPELIAAGFPIYEYSDERDSIHGKSILIDNNISIVGSFNLDPRSLYLSTESMFVIESHALAKQLSDSLNTLKRQSRSYNTEENNKHSSSKQPPWYKGALLNVCRILGRPFHWLL